MSDKLCRCGEPLSGRDRVRCSTCRTNDPHRHSARQRPEMFVSLDGEGVEDADGIMRLISVSYGREDGTSGSLTRTEGSTELSAVDAINWWFDNVTGNHTAADGVVWKQVPVAFHFTWDASVLLRSFDNEDMFLVHKSTARKGKRIRLCWSTHDDGVECPAFHRQDRNILEMTMSDGGENDLLAYDPRSGLAFASTPKRRFYVERRPNGDRFEGVVRLDVHDTGTTFGGKLLQVLDDWKPILDDDQAAWIKWGKVARTDGSFATADLRSVERYSEAETVAHARVCRLVINSIREGTGVRLRPSALFGPGAIAGGAFKTHGVARRSDNHESGDVFGGIAVNDLARLTYFGGLIETPVLGMLRKTVEEVDLNSAYPAQMVRLPCMREGHGEWASTKSWKGQVPDTVGHVNASWWLHQDQVPSTAPFTVRSSNHNVYQPRTGYRTWVTLPEFHAARAQFGDAIKCHEAVWWQQNCECPPPLEWLTEVYEARLVIKRQMSALVKGTDEYQELHCRQNAIKLVMNSCYGKLAQQRHGGGSYTNLHWASFITGSTRASVRRESWKREAQGGTVVYQHTDSVLSVGGTPEDGGKTLGAWGPEPPSNKFVVIQPGLAKGLDGGKSATRGVSEEAFVKAIKEWLPTVDLRTHPCKWPPIIAERTMMISRRMAISRGKPEQAGSFRDAPHIIKLTPDSGEGKRLFRDAVAMKDNPKAWIVPPIEQVVMVATVDDLNDFLSMLDRLYASGTFDEEEKH